VNTIRVTTGERCRTGVNETRFETRPGSGLAPLAGSGRRCPVSVEAADRIGRPR
jgi:hypothetical protein